jgi:hypothetical protein
MDAAICIASVVFDTPPDPAITLNAPLVTVSANTKSRFGGAEREIQMTPSVNLKVLGEFKFFVAAAAT